MQVVLSTNIKEYPLHSRGKVRDIYTIDNETLLIITTDRMSAFDVIMKEAIPHKGIILNKLTLFWMKKLQHIVPNHIVTDVIDDFPSNLHPYRELLEGRSVLVKKAQPFPVECIVRGYISGSGWKDYTATGSICGINLPKALKQSEELEFPIFTPSTKAAQGSHDENITHEQTTKILGNQLTKSLESISIQLFTEGSNWAKKHGIIIADTKFEFGLINNTITLIDEVLTPDSSRFWSKENYICGKIQPSFDKQYLRDWLESQSWDKSPPPPQLPEHVIENTYKKYHEAYNYLTGQDISKEY